MTIGRYTRIAAVGSALPSRVVPNSYFESIVDTSDQWIQERTGIKERRFAGPGESTASLSAEAASLALGRAGVGPESVDLLIIATCTPERSIPSTAAFVQARLGMSCPSFDLNAACAGFVYGLSVADAQIRAGGADRVMLVGAEVLSRVLDMTDRTTCVLFGDGAGAVVLEASDTPGILASDLHADGKHVGILCVPGTVSGGQVLGDPLLKMDGQAVFKLAVGVLEDAARAALAKAGKTDADIDWLIPHQANIRIMQGTAKKLKLPMNKLVVTVDEHGNTSAASIPLALDTAVRSGKIRKGDTLMLEGVGGGFTWGAVLLDF